MDMSLFKLDIDELINEFVEGESTTLADMKKIWLSRKFTYIFESSPATKLTFFMQSLYAHAIGHMISTSSLSQRLGGLYCLYCLYETQPFKPTFKIYLSLGELQKLKNLVVDAKEHGVTLVPALVKKMLERNMFLFGFVDLNEGADYETVNQLTELQNARVQFAYNKLFNDTPIEQFLHMDMASYITVNEIKFEEEVNGPSRHENQIVGMEFDLDMLKKMSTGYAEAKKQAIEEASMVVDVQNIQHISDDKEFIGDVVERITENWNHQREAFYQQTGFNQRHAQSEQQQRHEHQEKQNDNHAGDEFSHELELQLFEEEEEEEEQQQE